MKDKIAAKRRKIPKIPKNPAEQIVARVALKMIRLIGSDAALNLRIAGQPPGRTKISLHTGFGKAKDGSGFRGQLAFSMVAQDETTKKPAISIRCTYQMVYELVTGPEPTPGEVKAQEGPISQMVGFQGWPYIREHVHSTTLKMGLPGLVLPQFLITGRALVAKDAKDTTTKSTRPRATKTNKP